MTTEDIIERIYDMHAFFTRRGYQVIGQPIPGEEHLWLKTLQEGFALVEKNTAFYQKRYRYRGLSKNLLDALHRSLPEPCFGVIIASD